MLIYENCRIPKENLLSGREAAKGWLQGCYGHARRHPAYGRAIAVGHRTRGSRGND